MRKSLRPRRWEHLWTKTSAWKKKKSGLDAGGSVITANRREKAQRGDKFIPKRSELWTPNQATVRDQNATRTFSFGYLLGILCRGADTRGVKPNKSPP